ncbi:hypothetical protein J4406_00580 [Candidatus Woesearchaeota archaeon]|nr:hypothetical protein [Candidatus Woesearchaeota archaeon]
MDDDIQDILNKYKGKLKENIRVEDYSPGSSYSQEYQKFRKEALTRRLSTYESLCNFFERIFNIQPKENDYNRLQNSIETAHLNITPVGAYSFSITIALLIFLSLVLINLGSFLTTNEISTNLILLSLFILLVLVFIIKPLTNIPNYIASSWRLKASNQMVLCILYIVMYMRHTSNLENAIRFASEHIGPPLSLDLRKIFWNVETRKFSSMKESLDNYLEGWRDYSLEFVESFHLIEGSLFEASEERRVNLLEKALDVILNGTFEKMLHFSQELKNPITILNMLGVILPILGLVILPLIGSLMGGSGTTKIIIIFTLYCIVLPLVVYIFGITILSKKPTGYSETNLIEQNPKLKKYKNIIIKIGSQELYFSPLIISLFIFLVFMIISIIPIIFYSIHLDFTFLGANFIDFRQQNGAACQYSGGCYGPFGAGSVLLSLFFPLGLALSIGTYYYIRNKKLIKITEETKKLEKEFSGSLFQLGNRVGDGIPVELAFGDVAKSMRGTPTGNFFQTVSNNIQRFGADVKRAIFDPNIGAIWNYPSNIIESSMKILVESARKGPQIVARSLTSISTYLDRIHQVNERLKDLLSETLSSMKSQISFLTPMIAGIVVGLSTMIVTILGRLSALLLESSTQGQELSLGGVEALTGLFEIKNIIPSYYLQLIIGIYVVEIVIILTFLANNIESGNRISGGYKAGKNLYASGILYFFVSLIVTLIFTLLATNISIGGA